MSMAWSLYRWVWLVKSPLHVGMPPAGMLNRTRLYVPARALWGALTAELARLISQVVPEYDSVGDELQAKTRLTYLYPAEAVNGQWMAWLPRYQRGTGLVWQREDGRAQEDRALRIRLLITRPGTAIEPQSDTAAEGTLRELELISTHWRDGDNTIRQVALVGYLFCKDSALLEKLKQIPALWVGGDSRYGLGRLERVAWQTAEELFKQEVNLQEHDPVVRTNRVLAHTLPSSGSTPLAGALERLAGWDMRTGGVMVQDLTWAPGSASESSQDFVIQKEGLWHMR